MSSKMTLNEISNEIGVSRTTIYKVINAKGPVSDKTQKKVLDALDKYHYVPNYNARELAKGKKYRIGYVGMHHLSAQYFSSSVKEGFHQAYTDFVDNGFELITAVSDFNDPQKQLEDIEKMRRRGISHFIIAPSDEHLMRDKILELRDQGCDIIFLSRYIDVSKRTYVGVNYYNSGMLAAEMLTKIMPSGGKIIIVTNSSPEEDTTVHGRYTGFVDWMNRQDQFTILETIEHVNTDGEALDTFTYLRERYHDLTDIDAVYDITYKLNILAEKLCEIKMDQKVKLLGFDVYPENAKYIRSSAIDMVVGQQLRDQAYTAAKMMFQKICYGVEYQEKDHFSKLDVVVSSNLDCFL